MVLPYRTGHRAADPDQVYVDTARWGRWVITAAALACGAVAAAIIGVSYPLVFDERVEWVLVGVGCVSVTALAPILWSWLAVDGRGFRVDLGLLAGILATVLAHVVGGAIGIAVTAMLEPSGFSVFRNMAHNIGFHALVGCTTFYLVGWITVPIGAACGWIVTTLCRRRLRRALEAAG